MAFITLTVLSLASGILYARSTAKSGGRSPLVRAKTTLLQAKAHQKSLKAFVAESPDKQTDLKVLEEQRELKRTLSIFAGSSGLAISGLLFYPPLAILSILGALYLLREVYINTAKGLKSGKLTVDPLVAIFTISMFSQGYYVANYCQCE